LKLVTRLSLPEAIGLSLAVVSPTTAAAFNITLIVSAVGPAAPLTFAIGAVAMTLIALSFLAFTHRVAHAGSAYAYVTHTFGTRAGFIAGWTLLLTYLGFTTGFGALIGSFLSAALKGFGIDIGAGWIAIGAGSLLMGWWFTMRDMRLAGRLMLAIEALAVLAIVILCISILKAVHPTLQQTLVTLTPSTEFNGWTGIGFGMVFTILCFGGFEGAATLGEETINPRRNIPIALFGSVIASALYLMFVAYCEVIGFGVNGVHELAKAEAPLNDLALRYASPEMAIGLDIAAAISCFSGILGGMAAMSRVLFALGRAGMAPKLAEVDPVHGTPGPAVILTAVAIIVPFLAWAPFAGAGEYYSYTSTIGILSLILIYISVGIAEVVEAVRERRPLWPFLCGIGPLVLLWVLYCNIYPVPEYPNNLWPYATVIWVLCSWAIIKLRPGVARAPLPDYF
jgi:amino acid transporter